MDKQMVNRFLIILAETTSVGDYLTSFGYIVHGKNFVLQDELEEDIDFGCKPRDLGFGPKRSLHLAQEGEVTCGNRVKTILGFTLD